MFTRKISCKSPYFPSNFLLLLISPVTWNMVQKTIFTSNYFHVNRINFFLMVCTALRPCRDTAVAGFQENWLRARSHKFPWAHRPHLPAHSNGQQVQTVLRKFQPHPHHWSWSQYRIRGQAAGTMPSVRPACKRWIPRTVRLHVAHLLHHSRVECFQCRGAGIRGFVCSHHHLQPCPQFRAGLEVVQWACDPHHWPHSQGTFCLPAAHCAGVGACSISLTPPWCGRWTRKKTRTSASMSWLQTSQHTGSHTAYTDLYTLLCWYLHCT